MLRVFGGTVAVSALTLSSLRIDEAIVSVAEGKIKVALLGLDILLGEELPGSHIYT